MTAQTNDDQRLWHTLGSLEAKVDAIPKTIANEGLRTTQHIAGVKADIAGLSTRVDGVSERVDKVESELDRFRGASVAVRVAWMAGGSVITGLVLTVILRIMGV